MSDSNCAVCGAVDLEPGTACRACHASPQWRDLFEAVEPARATFSQLHEQGLLSETQLRGAHESLSCLRLEWSQRAAQRLPLPMEAGLRPADRCRQCGRPSSLTQKFCPTCGGATGARTDRLRHMEFVLHLFTQQVAPGMPADVAERCAGELRALIAGMEVELAGEAAAQPVLGAAASHLPGRRNLIEILLDPRSIRWLLASGGALLAVGLVIFLSSLGIFKNAMVVASAMGVGTLATLAGGISIVRFTRHTLAGRALALLGCLVMPLNLWFYNANHLVTLDGNLWVAAMVCCALYAAAAVVLEDPTFVYVLLGGIGLTGMLVLADLHRLAEISAPATLLMALGLVSLHAERAFAENDGPFSRKRFGLACFCSAQALIGLGLMMLLGSQAAAWATCLWQWPSHLAALPSDPWLAVALVLAGGYGFLYSSLVVRRDGIYGHLGVICLLWAELLGVQVGHLSSHVAVLLSGVALTSLAMNLAASLLVRNAGQLHKQLAGLLPLVGLGLMAVALAAGCLQQCRLMLPGALVLPHAGFTWSDLAATTVMAVSGRLAALLNAQRRERLSVAYLVAAAAATFIAAGHLLTLVGLSTGPVQAMALMAIPISYLFASRFHNDGPAKRGLPAIADAAVLALIFGSLIGNQAGWVGASVGQVADLWLAVFCLEAAVFFGVSAAMNRGTHHVYLAAVVVCGAVYQGLSFWAVPTQSYSVAFALAGIAGLLGCRFVDEDVRGMRDSGKALFTCANGLVSLPMAGAILMTLSRLAAGSVTLSMLWPTAVLSVLALTSAMLVSAGGGRRWYLSVMIGLVAVSLLALEQYSTLGWPRKLELFSVSAGMVLLVTGYCLWYRTQDGKSEGAGVCLLIGALLAGVPPAIFAVINRFGYDVSFVDELALVTIAVLMFLTGMMSRVRATTLIGGGLLACHLITLVVFAGMKAQLAVGAYVAVGGGALFAVGLLLSVSRDRLLTMPNRIKDRQGLFRVLAWK